MADWKWSIAHFDTLINCNCPLFSRFCQISFIARKSSQRNVKETSRPLFWHFQLFVDHIHPDALIWKHWLERDINHVNLSLVRNQHLFFAWDMGTGASKRPLHSTANAALVAARWMTNTQPRSASSSIPSGSANLAPNSDNKLASSGVNGDKGGQDLNPESRWGKQLIFNYCFT